MVGSKRAQAAIRCLAAASLSLVVFVTSTPAFAQTTFTVDADAKPYLIVCGIVATLLLTAIGGVCVRVGWRQSRLGEATRDWPTTSSQVSSAEVVKKTGYNDGEYQYYAPEIRYSYTVNGVSYTGQTIKFGTEVHYSGEELARERLTPYPVGTAPQVRYDPARPEISALEIGQFGGGRLVLFGAFWLLLALGAVWFTISTAMTPAG
jgi:Protein of unknown function (DUF3592)